MKAALLQHGYDVEQLPEGLAAELVEAHRLMGQYGNWAAAAGYLDGVGEGMKKALHEVHGNFYALEGEQQLQLVDGRRRMSE
jgi:hypothetical protein